MKRGYIATYTKMIMIILIIIVTSIGIVNFLKKEYSTEQIKSVKTDMLLIEGKIKIITEKVKIKEKDATYIGEKLTQESERPEIKELQEKGIIDLESKEYNYYALDKKNLEEIGLDNINLDDGYYIVEYNNSDVIYSKGVLDKDGKIYYKLSEIK